MIAVCECGASSLGLQWHDDTLAPHVRAAIASRRAAEWHDVHVLDNGRRVGVYRLSGGHETFAVHDRIGRE